MNSGGFAYHVLNRAAGIDNASTRPAANSRGGRNQRLPTPLNFLKPANSNLKRNTGE
jgi:hypothetical protein